VRHGSLFSGIGGFDLAAEWMGWENVFHCEWNEFGQKILKHYWPKAISYGDITKTDFTIHRGGIDILTGGFPCQPYSLAGKRKGKEDERHLWPEMLRAIGEIQPSWVVGENVPGIINWSGGLVFHEVQTDLEAQGYEVFPVILPACGVNAPHKRERIWFVAYNNGIIRGTGRKCEYRIEPRHGESTEKKITGITTNSAGDAITGQDRKGFKNEGTGIAINEQVRGEQLQAVQPNGLDDLSQPSPDTNGYGERLLCRSESEQRLETYPFDSNISRHEFTSNTESKRLQGYNERNGCSVNRNNEGIQSGAKDQFSTPNTNSRRQSSKEHRKEESRLIAEKSSSNNWEDFPTQSPLCSRNDGFSSRLDGITFSKWRNESIKGYGNAIVPEVVFQIFKAIEEINKSHDRNPF